MPHASSAREVMLFWLFLDLLQVDFRTPRLHHEVHVSPDVSQIPRLSCLHMSSPQRMTRKHDPNREFGSARILQKPALRVLPVHRQSLRETTNTRKFRTWRWTMNETKNGCLCSLFFVVCWLTSLLLFFFVLRLLEPDTLFCVCNHTKTIVLTFVESLCWGLAKREIAQRVCCVLFSNAHIQLCETSIFSSPKKQEMRLKSVQWLPSSLLMINEIRTTLSHIVEENDLHHTQFMVDWLVKFLVKLGNCQSFFFFCLFCLFSCLESSFPDTVLPANGEHDYDHNHRLLAWMNGHKWGWVLKERGNSISCSGARSDLAQGTRNKSTMFCCWATKQKVRWCCRI